MSYNNQTRDVMLDVKRGIELQINEYIEYHTKIDATERQRVTMFFDAVERHVAALFVARQIDNNYLVRSLEERGLEIKFSTKGHSTAVTFMLPRSLCWTVKKMINQVVKVEAPVVLTPPLTFTEACEACEAVGHDKMHVLPKSALDNNFAGVKSVFDDDQYMSSNATIVSNQPIRLDTVADVINYLDEQDRKDWRSAAIESHDRYVAKVEQSITEDYIFPHAGAGRGSLIDTLPGGENLGDLPQPHVMYIDIDNMPEDKVAAYLEAIRVEIRAKKMSVSNEQLSRDAYDKAMKVVG